MARKFLFEKHALIENYSTNQITQLVNMGTWETVRNITAGPASNNLSSLAANQQGTRVLYANYVGNGLVPFDFDGSTWIPGDIVTSGETGNMSAVAMSDDGLHALGTGDYHSTITPYDFNLSSGLWENKTPVSIGYTHINAIAMSRDGSRAIAVPKYDDFAVPLFRNPSSGVWSAATPIAINAATERFFSAAFSPDGNTVVIGSNMAGVSSDGLIWSGSSWTRVSIPVTMLSPCWALDGKSVIGGNGEGESGCIRVINFDPVAKTFSAGQELTGYGTIASVRITNDTVGDTALASDYNHNEVIPLQRLPSGLWEAGDAITSELFNHPWNMLVFPRI